MTQPPANPQDAAWAILCAARGGRLGLTRKAASFCGETAFDPTPLTEKQRAWLDTLIAKAGLPPIADTGGSDG